MVGDFSSPVSRAYEWRNNGLVIPYCIRTGHHSRVFGGKEEQTGARCKIKTAPVARDGYKDFVLLCVYQPCLATPAAMAASAFSAFTNVVSLFPLPSWP